MYSQSFGKVKTSYERQGVSLPSNYSGSTFSSEAEESAEAIEESCQPPCEEATYDKEPCRTPAEASANKRSVGLPGKFGTEELLIIALIMTVIMGGSDRKGETDMTVLLLVLVLALGL